MMHSSRLVLRRMSQEFLTVATSQLINFKNRKFSAQNDIQKFIAVFPDIVKDLSDPSLHEDVLKINDHYVEMLNCTVLPGSKTTGLTTLEAYKLLEKPENLTHENIYLASILGWCTEMFKTFVHLIEDIINDAEKRNGIRCWHQMENVGLNAINDSVILEQNIYVLLSKHFKNRRCYLPVVELFHDVTMQTTLGQIFENILIKKGKPRLELFTPKNFNYLTTYKTTYHLFYLPITLSMYLSHIYKEQLNFQVREILAEIGRFYHIQKNYTNCAEERDDIANGKCTWLAVSALDKANSYQKEVMEKHYGIQNSESVKTIQNLYKELTLQEAYDECKQESYKRVQALTGQVSQQPVQEVLVKMADTVYALDSFQ